MADSKLNPKFTLQNFVEGDANRAAYMVASAVAQKPGTAHNPLFICGGVGTGKTHLLHAIGNTLDTSGSKLYYRTSEDFLNGVKDALKADKLFRFHERIHNIDVLLLDDIQLFEGKQFMQKELLRTLDILCGQEKQVVLVCDRTPKELNFADRLKDRLEGGLVVRISNPGNNLKLSILKAKIIAKNLELSEDVVAYVANVSSTVRELEGAINQLDAYRMFSNRVIALDVAHQLLGKEIVKPIISMKDVTEIVAKKFGMTHAQLRAKSNLLSVVTPRSIAMYIARKTSDLSFPEIGRYFSKHHTTVIHSVQKIDAERQVNSGMDTLLTEIEKTLLSEYARRHSS